jgi:predicted DNA-binding transcriptional regulator YafY
MEQVIAAINNHETLRVRYAGGSQPTTTRDIQPVRLDCESVQALCVATGIVKHAPSRAAAQQGCVFVLGAMFLD